MRGMSVRGMSAERASVRRVCAGEGGARMTTRSNSRRHVVRTRREQTGTRRDIWDWDFNDSWNYLRGQARGPSADTYGPQEHSQNPAPLSTTTQGKVTGGRGGVGGGFRGGERGFQKWGRGGGHF